MDAQRLVGAVASLSQTATEDFAVTEMLQVLGEAAAAALRVDGAGVMLRRDGRDVFVHASGTYAKDIQPLERLQEALQAGPSADSIAQGIPVTSGDLSRDDRWPEFRSLAAELQLGAVVAIPLASRGRGWGVLDLYRRAASAWAAEELHAAQALANLAASYLVMAHDRDQARIAQQALAHRPSHDDLTGLANRALLSDRLQHALATAHRQGTGVAVVFLDLDLFKFVNDTFGHTAADGVLVEVAGRLSAALRGGDTLARFAGDQFVIVCQGLPRGEADALAGRVAALTGRLQRALQTGFRIGQVNVVLSASIGVAITSDRMTGQELLAAAASAMHAAKRSGRGQVRIHDQIAASAPGHARQLERGLVGASAGGRKAGPKTSTRAPRGLGVIVHLLAELQLAKQRLDEAFDWARTADYQPGSLPMHRLAAAEHGYRQARQRYERDLRAALPGGPQHTTVDLRDFSAENYGGGPGADPASPGDS